MIKFNNYLCSGSSKNILQYIWVLWTLILFYSYFYNMITLPERFEKIRAAINSLF